MSLYFQLPHEAGKLPVQLDITRSEGGFAHLQINGVSAISFNPTSGAVSVHYSNGKNMQVGIIDEGRFTGDWS